MEGQILKAPKPRSRSTVKPSTYSRSKDIKILTPILKAETIEKSSIIPDAETESKQHQRHKFYFPLKDLSKYESMPDENCDPSSSVVSPIAKGWEARIFEKNREHVRKRNSALARAHSVRNWTQFEQVQNSRNVLASSNVWNKSPFNGAAPDSRGNLKMSYYSDEFRKEPDVRNPDPNCAGDLVDDLIGGSILRKYPQVDLYTELIKYLSIDTTSETIPQPKVQTKTVSFAPETVFHERNLNSYFWRDILWRQRARRSNRQKRNSVTSTSAGVNVNSSTSVATATTSLPQTQRHPGGNYKIVRRPTKAKVQNSNPKAKHGFWDGIGRFVSTVFGCQSSRIIIDPATGERIHHDQYEKVISLPSL